MTSFEPMDIDASHFHTAPLAAPRPGIEPFLKWPGGKRSLLKHLLPLVPANVERYYEGFVGGGALFFALQPRVAVLSDGNGQLMNCYQQVRDRPEDVIAILGAMNNSERDYYAIRNQSSQDPVAQAARLIYLVTLSFNGIYRENTRGAFNVPYGHKIHVNPCNPTRIQAASQALQSADLHSGDFEGAVASAQSGDFVYLDPPYTVAHSNNGFVKYNARVFSWTDQGRLAGVARTLAERGCRVVVSNADHPSIEALYSGFTVVRVRRASTIAASGKYRGHAGECVFFNAP